MNFDWLEALTQGDSAFLKLQTSEKLLIAREGISFDTTNLDLEKAKFTISSGSQDSSRKQMKIQKFSIFLWRAKKQCRLELEQAVLRAIAWLQHLSIPITIMRTYAMQYCMVYV